MTQEENNEDIINGLMPKEAFERRFSFIADDTLKKNIAITFEYIIFLIEIASKEDHKPLIRSSLYKDAAVYTGTVVEACLAYLLRKYLTKYPNQKAKVLEKEWKTKEFGIIHEFSKKKRIRYVVEQSVSVDIGNSPMFAVINRTCLRAKVLSKKEFGLAEEIMKARNKIHVSGLKEIDNAYNKETLDAIFDKASKIIKKVEKKLAKISSN